MKPKTLINSLLLTLWSILPSVFAGVWITIRNINVSVTQYLIQGSLITAALILTGAGIKITHRSINLFQHFKAEKWMVLILLIELLPFVSGIHLSMKISVLSSLVFLMFAAGLFEEIIFRGIILESLEVKDTKFAIIASALFFGFGHAAHLLGGQDLFATLHQILFALLFGIVSAAITIKTKSLTIGICWHIMHNIIDQITGGTQNQIQFLVLFSQIILLAVMAIILWKGLFWKRTSQAK